MLFLRVLYARVAAFCRRQPLDDDLEAELAAHLELATDANIARGLRPDEARRAARIELGSLDSARELHRESRGLPRLDALLRDLQISLRALRRDRAFTVVSVLILSLAIGAATTVFSVVRAVLLEPLPFDRPEKLVWIAHTPLTGSAGGLSEVSPSATLFEEWEARTSAYTELAAYNAFFAFDSHRLAHDAEPLRLVGVEVSRNLFEVLGLRPLIGRFFDEVESAANGPPAVILGYPLWYSSFRADRDIVGRTITLDGRPVTVAGVMPRSFDFGAIFAPGTRVDLFTPLVMESAKQLGNTLAVVGRLKPQITVASADAELTEVTEKIRQDWSTSRRYHMDARVTPLVHQVSGAPRRALWILLACVGAVLLIACTNLSNLQLARSITRRKELAVRAALGAGRWRLVQQLTVESLVLTGVGAVLGLGLAFAATQFIARLHQVSVPLLYRAQVDTSVLIFATLVTALASIVLGLIPALQLSGKTMSNTLASSSRGSTQTGWQRKTRSALVVVEIALACILLAGAGLLVRSFRQALDVDLGFEPTQALALRVDSTAPNGDLAGRVDSFTRMVEAVEAVPGVVAAGVTDSLPLDRNRTWWIWAPGQTYEPGHQPGAFVSRVSGGYLTAMGIPLQAGRDFDSRDNDTGVPVVIVNEAAAELLYPGVDAVGNLAVVEGQPRTIIGIAVNVRRKSIEAAENLEIYLPMAQVGASAVSLIMRTEASSSPEGDIRTALRALDATLPVLDLRPLTGWVERALSVRRFFMTLLGGFAAFALVLAALGIYGVISYSVNQRAGEIAIRMALGASAQRLRLAVLRETLILAGVGILLGTLGALALGRIMRSLLFAIPPTDPVSYLAMLLAASAIALIAGSLPAARAGRVDPLSALRQG